MLVAAAVGELDAGLDDPAVMCGDEAARSAVCDVPDGIAHCGRAPKRTEHRRRSAHEPICISQGEGRGVHRQAEDPTIGLEESGQAAARPGVQIGPTLDQGDGDDLALDGDEDPEFRT